jgi:TIR domain
MTNFFVSYTGADAAWAEWIAWQLEEGGYTVVLQAWDSRPGDDFVVWMDQAIRSADRVLVVLSPAYEQAVSFTVPEWSAALGRDPTGKLGVLPVRVADFTPAACFAPGAGSTWPARTHRRPRWRCWPECARSA